MAVYFGDKESYKGAVLKEESHMWMDGMEEVYAVVWDVETESIKRIQIGYYGIDGQNIAGGRAVIDATRDVKRAVRRSLKESAYKEFCKRTVEYKSSLREGRKAEVVKGRKVAKGTVLEVFWIGEKETYKSRMYAWMHEYELIAGCYNNSGEKVYIKAEYLKPIDKVKSPTAKERKAFMKSYINYKARELGA